MLDFVTFFRWFGRMKIANLFYSIVVLMPFMLCRAPGSCQRLWSVLDFVTFFRWFGRIFRRLVHTADLLLRSLLPTVVEETLPSPHPVHVLLTTVEPPTSTPFRPPPGLLHRTHSTTRACRPRPHGYGFFPRWRENLATTCPSFRLHCSILKPTRQMAWKRAPDRHA